MPGKRLASKGQSILGAGVIQFASKYAAILIQLIITAVLARLITPEQFGVVAIVSVFTAFFSMFADMGISSAIVQYRDLSEEDLGGLFVFSGVLGCFLSALFCGCSFAISLFYQEGELVLLCCASAPMILFATLNMVPNGLMLREKRFFSIGIRLVVATLVAGVCAIFLAWQGANCYAIVWQSNISTLIILVWNLASRPIRHLNPRFTHPLKRIFSYSAFQFGFSLINYFARNLDNLLIGKWFGAASLGFYDKAYKLTTYPMSSISSVVASVIQPFMAENQENPRRVFECWLRVEKAISLVASPVSAILCGAGLEIVLLFYGVQWGDSVPLFQALAVSVYFQMMNNTSGAFFQSLGKTKALFFVGLINTCATLILLVVGLMSGSLLLTAVCVSLSFCLHSATNAWMLIGKAFGESLLCLKSFIPEILIGISAVLVCAPVSYFVDSLPVVLLAKVVIVAIVFLCGYRLTGQLGILLGFLKRRR